MDFTTIFIIAGVVLLAIFFLIARLAVRWIVRLIIIGVILAFLVGGGGLWWWTTRLAPTPKPKPRPTPTRRSALEPVGTNHG
jgi:hypothetical protein